MRSKPRKPRGASRFRKREVERLARAAVAAGLTVDRIDVDLATGRLSLIPVRRDAAAQPDSSGENGATSELDRELEEFEASHEA